MIVSDSLLPPVAAADGVDTLQICSPGQLLNTDVAQETLKDLDTHDKSVEAEVQDCSKYTAHLFPIKCCCVKMIRCYLVHIALIGLKQFSFFHIYRC